MNERIERVRGFFASGGSICPYAKKYADRTGFGAVPDAYRPRDIRYPILEFVKSPEMMAATYVFASDLASHEKERARSAVFFKDVFRVLLIDEYGTEAYEVFPEMERHLDEMLSPESDKNPFLVHRQKHLFYVAMNPLYHETHPRWLPCSSVVITRGEDVDNVGIDVRDKIRREMKKRPCRAYDADQFYLMP